MTTTDPTIALQTIDERLTAAVRALDTLTGAISDARHVAARAGVGKPWMDDGSTVAVCAAVEEHEATLADLLADLDSPRPHTLTIDQRDALSAVVAPLLALLEARRG